MHEDHAPDPWESDPARAQDPQRPSRNHLQTLTEIADVLEGLLLHLCAEAARRDMSLEEYLTAEADDSA